MATREHAANKKVVVFGIFDGVHDGHRDLFRQAKEKGGELFVIVGRDEMCKIIKGKTPRYSGEDRVGMVEREPLVAKAVLGDTVQSSYKALREIDPDVICFGYDQSRLRDDCSAWVERHGLAVELYLLKPYRPETLHNSFLRE